MTSSLVIVAYVVGVSITAGACFLINRFLKWYYSPLWSLPGPKASSFWVGDILKILKQPYMQSELTWWRDAGLDTKLIHFSQPFGKSSLLVLDKEIARIVLTSPAGTKSPRFPKGASSFRFLGGALPSLNGADWKRHRRIMEPSFNSALIKAALSRAVPPRINRMIQAWNKAADTRREIDVISHMSGLTLDILGEVAFSYDFKGIKAIEEWADKADDMSKAQVPEPNDKFIRAMTELVRFDVLSAIWLLFEMPVWVLKIIQIIKPNMKRARTMLDEAAEEVIANVADNDEVGQNNKSLLHLMVDAQDPDCSSSSSSPKGRSLNRIELQDEIKAFVLAGHETTAVWSYWSMYVLAKYPDIQELVYQDVIKHAPPIQSNDGDNGGESDTLEPITLEQAIKMEYLAAFLQEVNRLYPAIARIRRVTAQTEHFAGTAIPAGTRLIIAPFLLHRHPSYWDDPLTFRPERWINVGKEDAERRRFAYLPFSAGSRACIGQHFATLEAQFMLAPLIRAFCMDIAPSQRDTKFEFASLVTMQANPDIKVVVQKRNYYSLQIDDDEEQRDCAR